jgi:multisubunit Na+/H+ antiporter MnhE subunit
MVLGTVVLFLVWLAMTRTLAIPYVIAGAISAAVVVAAWSAIMPKAPTSVTKLIRHPIYLLRFILVLVRRFVVSTLSTSWLILRGGEEGRMMALPIRVEDSLARFILLNSITLTPSTISLLAEDDLLYIHWLQPANGQGDWREIKESFETRLRKLFEEDRHADH